MTTTTKVCKSRASKEKQYWKQKFKLLTYYCVQLNQDQFETCFMRSAAVVIFIIYWDICKQLLHEIKQQKLPKTICMARSHKNMLFKDTYLVHIWGISFPISFLLLIYMFHVLHNLVHSSLKKSHIPGLNLIIIIPHYPWFSTVFSFMNIFA